MDQFPKRCVLCGNEEKLVSIEKQEYTLWRCKACLGQFWWPFQNPGAEWYEQDTRYHGRNRDPLLTPVDSHLLFLEDKPCPKGEVLDIGCGTGNFLAAARNAGYQVAGIDFDRDAIEVAKSMFGLTDLRVASVEDLEREEQRYDVVTFFEVLEHMDNPVAFLKQVRTLLRPGGYIAVSVPDAASWNIFKEHDKPPRHLTRWSDASLARFLSGHGFMVKRITQKRLPFTYLITKFHFWTARYFSYGLVEKLQAKKQGATLHERVNNRAIRRAKQLAKIKDYVLFAVPAALLWGYLVLTRQASGGLYVLAQRYDA